MYQFFTKQIKFIIIIVRNKLDKNTNQLKCNEIILLTVMISIHTELQLKSVVKSFITRNTFKYFVYYK